MRRKIASVLLVLLSAGCSSATTSGPKSRPDTPVTLSASPVDSSYAQRVTATIRVDNGDGLAAAGGAIWVKTDDGRVVKVDPKTSRVTGAVTVDAATDPNAYCQGITALHDTVWACSTRDGTTDLARVDTASLTVKRRVAVAKVFDQLTLPAVADSIWVLSANGTQVTRLNTATGQTVTAPLGTRCLQLAADREMLVATCVTESVVLRLDPRTGQVRQRAKLPQPRLAAVRDGDIWVDTAQGLTRLRADLSTVTTYPSLSSGPGGDLVSAAGAIWLRATNGTITKIDPITGRVLERITPDEDLTPGSLLVTTDGIWTTSSDDGLLYRLSRSS